MKKLFSLLLLLVAFNTFGQIIVHNQPVRLKQVSLGVQSDSLVMIDGVGELKYLPLSDIQISPEVAIISKDEGSGQTFYPQVFSRDFKGVGGAGALDMSFADGVGGYGALNGALGDQSFVMGYNSKAEGYGSFLLGQDSDIPASGTYAFNIGTDNTIGGYSGIGLGTFLTNTTNYGIQIGHTIEFNQGGLNVGIGFGLSETTANSDKVAIFGQGNKEPINSEGFNANNIGTIIGSGDLTGTGSTPFVRVTPRNSIVVFRDAEAGLVNLEASTLANLKVWDDTFPHAAATVEYVQDAVTSGTSGDALVGVDEGSGIGFVRSTDDRTDKGTIGASALDLSVVGVPAVLTAPFGAIGDASFSMGYDNIASGYGAFAMGEENLSSGTHSFSTGVYNEATNYANFAVGGRNKLTGFYSTALGISNWDQGEISFMMGMALRADGSQESTIVGRSNVTPSTYLTTERVNFIVGTGTTQGDITTSPNGATPLVQQDGLRVFEGGLVTAPSQTSVLINANDDALITKEYADATYIGGGGTIGGTIADTQVAFGNGTNAIEGRAGFTASANAVSIDSLVMTGGITLPFTATSGLGKGAIWKDGSPFIFSSGDNEPAPNIFFGIKAGAGYATHGTGTEPNDGNNVGIGSWSLNALGENGYQNTAVGGSSMELTTTGDWNVGVGAAALYYNTTGSRNTAVGRNSGSNNIAGHSNLFAGNNAGIFFGGAANSLSVVEEGIFIGADTDALANNSTNEIVIGFNAVGGGSNTAMIGNGSITKISAGADYNATADKDLVTKGYADATYLGGAVDRLDWSAQSAANGDYTINVKGQPFLSNYWGNTTASANDFYTNTFVGIGSGNYAVGDGLSGLGEGGINVGVGAYTLNALTTGMQNVMVGNESGALMTTANRNIGIGDGVFYFSVDDVNDNVGIGKNVFQNLTSGDFNMALGRNSGYYAGSGTSTTLTSGDNHTLLGASTRPSANGTTNEIVIGSDALGNGSNTATIGSSATTDIYLGEVGGAGGAYWNDGESEFTRVRPYFAGFDVETKTLDAFGGGVDKLRLAHGSISATDRRGYLQFIPEHGQNLVSLEFRAVDGGEAGVSVFSGDYFDFAGTRIEKATYDLVIDNGTGDAGFGAFSNQNSEVRMTESATPKTMTLQEGSISNPGESWTIIQTGAGAITVACENANVSINGVAGGSVTIAAQYSSIQIIVKAQDEYIIIGNFN